MIDVPRRIAISHAWSKVGETTAALEVIENRFPTPFESRRILNQRVAEFADTAKYDQDIGGLLDNIRLARHGDPTSKMRCWTYRR